MARVWSLSTAAARTVNSRYIPRAIFLLFLTCAAACSAPFDAQTVEERVRTCTPTWESYQETIKAEIGAGPVAQWTGSPTGAVYAAGEVTVTFRVEGPWADAGLAMPILMRGPDMNAQLPIDATVSGEYTTYRYTIDTAAIVPWVDVRFPRATERMQLIHDRVPE